MTDHKNHSRPLSEVSQIVSKTECTNARHNGICEASDADVMASSKKIMEHNKKVYERLAK